MDSFLIHAIPSAVNLASWILLLSFLSSSVVDAMLVRDGIFLLNTTEAFFIELNKSSFGKDMNSSDHVEFLTSVSGMADLPDWMFYKQSGNQSSEQQKNISSSRAYLYGTPTDDGDFEIEVIALNKRTYETSRDTIKLTILEKEKKAQFEVEMKFYNMNVDDMFLGDAVNDVLEIFRDRLWKHSHHVYVTRVASPVDVGARLPVDPSDKEGVIIRIGSSDDFSGELLDLEREVERIKNRNPCPRKYKATSAEYLFRRKNFENDWCSFSLIRVSCRLASCLSHVPFIAAERQDANGTLIH